jgi:predicted lipid-binding transport protein (Tim44 family)
MDGSPNIFTLIFLVLAVVIFLKLRSVLGRRTQDDEARIDRVKERERARAEAAAQARDKVVTLPRRPRDEVVEAPPAAPAPDVEARIRSTITDPAMADSLIAVYRADPSFNPEDFISGARQAYEMIVTAFAEGNRKVLKGLLSNDVFDGFASAINDRETRGEQIDQSFVGINKAEIVEAEVTSGMAQVTVKFVSELISATRDRAGTVIAGDPKRIKEVVDVWTFARETNSRDPNWKLIATGPGG